MIEGPILALDSSTSLGSVAVGDGSGVLAEVVRSVAGGHSAALLPAVDRAMRDAGLRPADLAAVVVAGGPGSFTGLRIAAATAKGMVRALGVPLLAYSGLLAAAASAWSAPGPVCALFDARRGDVFAACYRFDDGLEERLAPTALPVEALVERLRDEEPPVFAGDGAVLHRAALERGLGARVLPPHLGVPRASALLWLATAHAVHGRVDDPAAWEPEYVRASGAERIAARAARGAR